MILIKRQLEFTEEEKILYKRFIKKASKNERVMFIKVPIFLASEIYDSPGYTKYRIVYSDGIKISREIFEIDNKKYNDIIDFKENGPSYAVIFKKKTHGFIFEDTISKLFKLSLNPYCKWEMFKWKR